jgi:hypothetical protein
MSLHVLVYDREEGDNAVFKCTKCDKEIGFNKTGVGEPCADDNGDGTWSHPEDPEQWMGPCPVEDPE